MNRVESSLWSTRWLMLVTVLAVICGSFALIGFVVSDFIHLLQVIVSHGFSADVRTEVLLIIIEIVDQALMAGVMIIFGLGIYEIFIDKIDIEGETSPQLLIINSISQLKGKLGSLVIMILIVKFLSLSIEMEISTPTDLLMYAASVALLGLALFLTSMKVK